MDAPSADTDLVTTLRARGHRLTPQRLLVLAVMQRIGNHLTADTVYTHVIEQYPYINRATVYRTLAWLTAQGLVSVTDLGHGHMEYQSLAPRRHHHLVCLDCGAIAEFSDDLIAPLAAALRTQHGFAPRLDHLAVYGYCAQCQEQHAAGSDAVSA